MLAAKNADSLVVMCYLMDKNISPEEREVSLNVSKMLPSLLCGMPIHLAAMHLGYDSEVWAPVESWLKFFSSDDHRIRVRAFQGKESTFQCQANIESWHVIDYLTFVRV